MVWDIFKKVFKNKEDKAHKAPAAGFEAPVAARCPAPAPDAPAPSPVREKSLSAKTDEDLARELDAISPEILSQAKNPQMRALIINIYRKMLADGVNINDDKEVKRWLKKHPEVVSGGETHKIETFRREDPKVGRNDACACGSGKKYKKCCGKEK